MNQESNKVKKKPILVIVGNPPYSGISRHDTPGLIDKYKQIDGKPLNEKKHWLNDDYVKFIAFAQDKMDEVEEGIVAVITNHGFIDNPTFRGMRASLLKTFNQIYVLNLHGNSKKKEVCPDGSKDENVFDITQGVSINFFIKKKSLGTYVGVYDFWGDRETKFKDCYENSFASLNWNRIKPQAEEYLLVKQDNTYKFMYDKIPYNVQSIFKINTTGIVTARDNLVIDFEENNLLHKITEFRDLKFSDEDIKQKYSVSDNYQWKISESRKSIQNSKIKSDNVSNIAYRPFDNRKIYLDKNLVFRDRQKVMQHMLLGENVGLLCARSNKSNKADHFLVSKYITEIKTAESTTCSCLFPLYLYHSTTSDQLNLKSTTPNKTENFAPEFRSYINNLYNHHFSPEEIMGYIYGVLHSPFYREKYLQFLKMDFPRIPFTKDKKQFLKLSKLGWGMIGTHLMKEMPNTKLGSYEGKGDDVVAKPNYDAETKRLYINQTQYFDKVSENIWNFYIGGYQVLDKYLKYRKGRKLSFEEIENVENVVNILNFTITQMQKIDEVYKEIDKEFVI